MQKNNGFTLIELMIVIAIIGILASVAVPMYGNYTKRAKFADIINQTAAYKTAVSVCVQDLNTITGCSHNTNSIPDAIANKGNLASLQVVNGQITAVGTQAVDNANFILTPTWTPATNTLDWVVDAASTCGEAQLCKEG